MSEQPNHSISVAGIQWDPAVTAFGSIDRLRALVAATSRDDVQVTAVVSLQVLLCYIHGTSHQKKECGIYRTCNTVCGRIAIVNDLIISHNLCHRQLGQSIASTEHS